MLEELVGTLCCPYFTIWIHLKSGARKGDISKRFLHTRKASRVRWGGWTNGGQLLEKLQMWQGWFYKTVFPVFYDVDPSEVGNQTGRYGEEFAKHQIRFKDQMERVEGWREALKEVAYMEGMVLEDGYESEFIESIVREIADKLNLSLPHVPFSSLPLSSALCPPSYFFGLLREWRRSFFPPSSLLLFFLTSQFFGIQ
ncbi:uncharacterized protein LOC133694041 isoform X2 [Populus nigra]|uniref:uncharacterized protein LOC133694041 isoform X2 n=1 Tax=Populus nigra TaxID=3691 RepID=UPI002B2758B1|nr:uncharacterized protein LOC133694041 isoform X2 [Populus nigra]